MSVPYRLRVLADYSVGTSVSITGMTCEWPEMEPRLQLAP